MHGLRIYADWVRMLSEWHDHLAMSSQVCTRNEVLEVALDCDHVLLLCYNARILTFDSFVSNAMRSPQRPA